MRSTAESESIAVMVTPQGSKRRARPAVPPIDTGLTLAQLSDAVAEMTGPGGAGGDPDGLSGALRRYRGGRDTVTALRAPERRDTVARAALAALMRGVDNDGRWRIERVETPDRTQRRLTSEAVRRAAPELWQAAKVTGYRLSVTPGMQWSAPRVPAVRSGTVGQLIESMRLDALRVAQAAADADTARAALIDTYAAIEAVRPWGGDPLGTIDGWVIGYTQTSAFNRAVCAVMADEQGIDVEPMLTPVMVRGGVRWRVVDVSAVDAADSDGGDQYAQ